MKIVEIIKYSGLNNFLYTSDNLVSGFLENKKYYIIFLDLKIKEISYIKEKFDNFKEILEKILFTFNQSSNSNFSNITFNNIKINGDYYNNCIFLYNSDNGEPGYRTTKNTIKVFLKTDEKESKKEKTILDKIVDLIISKNISVRNLIKIGLVQIKARRIYDFLKEKEVFVISKYNNNHKTFYLDNLKKISKKELESLILG